MALCDDRNFRFQVNLSYEWNSGTVCGDFDPDCWWQDKENEEVEFVKSCKQIENFIQSSDTKQTKFPNPPQNYLSPLSPWKPIWTSKLQTTEQTNATRSLATTCHRDNFSYLHRLTHLREIEQYCFCHLSSWSRALRRTSMWSCTSVMFCHMKVSYAKAYHA